ncbi:uncharacterized protein LOC131892361 isoform X1 [Tigriopus californicus]|uniref:uncharacterized protein LOC131892361 isoform X1 n=2 Tax=Tigriopus californicus TaxID=6832 RepID=UPI0027DA3C2F|nr:uncharacterized protein LOC131892361 isoform X1 [Tigriopus californicus]
MTAETDFGDPASSVQSAVQGSINDYRLTLFITSSSIIIITLITIIGAVSCFILCNEDEELKEAELILDTPTREAYEGMIQALKEGKDISFPGVGQDEFTIAIDTESPMKTSFQTQDDLEVAKNPQDHPDPIPPQTYQLRPDSLMGGSMHHLQSGESPFHQSTPTPLIKRSLFSVLEEDSSSPHQQIPSLTLTSAKEMGPSTIMGAGGGYSTKEDEFSNLIGLDESTEHTLNQLEADFARMRKTSERRRRQRSRAERMSFSEWTQKSKENQFKSASPHRRKSFISRLKRNSSDRTETRTGAGQELSTISSFSGSTMVTLSGGIRRRTGSGLTCFSGSLPVMKVLDDRMDILAVPNLATTLSKTANPKPVFHCEPIVRVMGSQNRTRSSPLGADGLKQRSPKSKTISIQTEPLESQDKATDSPKKEEKPQRPSRLCTHCLETYTSPKRQQLTFLERKRFFESMATTPK